MFVWRHPQLFQVGAEIMIKRSPTLVSLAPFRESLFSPVSKPIAAIYSTLVTPAQTLTVSRRAEERSEASANELQRPLKIDLRTHFIPRKPLALATELVDVTTFEIDVRMRLNKD